MWKEATFSGSSKSTRKNHHRDDFNSSGKTPVRSIDSQSNLMLRAQRSVLAPLVRALCAPVFKGERKQLIIHCLERKKKLTGRL